MLEVTYFFHDSTMSLYSDNVTNKKGIVVYYNVCHYKNNVIVKVKIEFNNIEFFMFKKGILRKS